MTFYHDNPGFQRAELIDRSNPEVQKELRDIALALVRIRNKYKKSSRQAEFEGRVKEYGNFGLTQEEIDLLWEADVAPWDNYVSVSASRVRLGWVLRALIIRPTRIVFMLPGMNQREPYGLLY